ncbi:MAG: polysaccharide deacetylase family protein [Planctomycetes bacterium]|nr:polysaccharide deacetylase family protein [Planctomycetota bacterium]MBI3836110.1 polysaccharide deacetylase family protein [Planctomycetota bacterium]
MMYHYVHDVAPQIDQPASGEPCGIRGLTRAAIAEQIDALSRNYEPIDWPKFYAWTQGRWSAPHRCFLLTFDDGLADHAESVVPILQDRGLRSVFFVPGTILARRQMLSAHAVHLLLNLLGVDGLSDELQREIAQDADLQSAEGRYDNENEDSDALRIYGYESPELARLKHLITWRLPIDARNRMIERLFERHVGSAARWSDHWYLGWKSLVEMQSMGHTIGGHGFDHEPYSRFSVEECRNDAFRVASVLRDGLGADARPFSYPFGDVTSAASEAIARAGFVQAFTTEKQWAAQNADPLRIPRIDTISIPLVSESKTCCGV